MSLFTLSSRQRSDGWHSRELGANTRAYEREHVAFNCARVINYHRWVVISRDERNSLIVARLVPPFTGIAQECSHAEMRSRARAYGCVRLYVCVCAPVGPRSNPGAMRWRTDVLTGCSAPTTGVRWTIRREASGGRSTTHSTPLRIRHPCPRHPHRAARCSAFARFYHLVVERAPSYAPPREIARNFWKCHSCYRKRIFQNRAGFCGEKNSLEIREMYCQKNVAHWSNIWILMYFLILM